MKTKERSYMFIGLAFTSQAFFLFLVVLSPRRSTISNEKRKTKMGEAIVLYRGRGSSVDPELLKPTTIISNGTYTAPITGTYRVSCVGGGGGGGGGCRNSWNSSQVFYGAGGSRGSLNTMNVVLNAGDKVQVNLGSGGAGGTNNTTVVSNNSRGTNGRSGGTTTFGSYVSGAGGSYGAWSWSRHYWSNIPTWNNYNTYEWKFDFNNRIGKDASVHYYDFTFNYDMIIVNSYVHGWSEYTNVQVGLWMSKNTCTLNMYTDRNNNFIGPIEMNAKLLRELKENQFNWYGYWYTASNWIFRLAVPTSGDSLSGLALTNTTPYKRMTVMDSVKDYQLFESNNITNENSFSGSGVYVTINKIKDPNPGKYTYAGRVDAHALFYNDIGIPTVTNRIKQVNSIENWNNQIVNTTTRCYTSIRQGSWWYTSANNVTTSGTRSYRGDGGASGQAGNAGFILIIPPQSA